MRRSTLTSIARSGAVIAALAGSGLSGTPAWACPVCFGSSSNQVLYAFYASTVALSLLPFLLIGAFAFYLSRLSRGSAGAERRSSALDGPTRDRDSV